MDVGKFHILRWLCIDSGDIFGCIGQNLQHIVQKTCSIQTININMRCVFLRRGIFFPFDINQALFIIFLRPQIHTVLTVNCHATPFGNVPDNLVTRNWIATFGNPYQKPRRTLDNNAALMLDFQRFFILTLHFTALDKLFCFSSRFSTLFLTALFFGQTVKNRNRTNLTKTNRRKKSFFCFVARFLQDFFHVLFVHVFISYIAMFLELCL